MDSKKHEDGTAPCSGLNLAEKNKCTDAQCKDCTCKKGCCKQEKCSEGRGCCAQVQKTKCPEECCKAGPCTTAVCPNQKCPNMEACICKDCCRGEACTEVGKCPAFDMCPFDNFFGATGIVRCTKNNQLQYKLTLPHGIQKSDVSLSQKGNTVTVEYKKEVKQEEEWSSRTGTYSFTMRPQEKVKNATIKGCTLSVEMEEGAKESSSHGSQDGPIQIQE
ncbi:hypothetical protein NECID01_0828 [Nematocida sp. AWRm77]|nr:hypothetical protein NECID01_0828 [Nematocida sp. AWRm77]